MLCYQEFIWPIFEIRASYSEQKSFVFGALTDSKSVVIFKQVNFISFVTVSHKSMRADETLGLRVRISTAEYTRKATSNLIQVTTDGIQVSDFPDTGRGCQATKDLSQGQVILNVKDVVTVEKVIEAEFGGHPCPVSKSGIVR